LRVSHELQDGKWLIRLHVGINNLFDEDYNNNIRINASGSRFFEPAPDRNSMPAFSPTTRGRTLVEICQGTTGILTVLAGGEICVQ
jgi:hypothetical protein